MNNFPKLFAIVSLVLLGGCPLGGIIGAKAAGLITAVFGFAWVVWNVFGLYKFESSDTPKKAPLLCLCIVGIFFQFAAGAAVSSAAAAPLIMGCGIVFAALGFLGYVFVTDKLLSREFNVSLNGQQVEKEKRQPVLKRRILAGLIDAGLLAVMSAVLMSSTIIVTTLVWQMANPAINPHAKSLIQVILPVSLVGAGTGLLMPLAAATNVFCSVCGLTKLSTLSGTEQLSTLAALLSLGLVNIAGILYFAFLESSTRQASIGKRIMGLRVVDSEGGRLNFRHALFRTALKSISFGTFLLGFIYATFSPKGHALHDIVAKSEVVRG